MAGQADEPEEPTIEVWLTEAQERGALAPATRVKIAYLSAADSPRISGENLEHTRLLAKTDADFPPIIVHRDTMRVIDGVHRLHAARLRGEEEIAVRFFSGDEADAFVVAVKSNIAHGLPLSLADREAAAARIIRTHPQWSDRMIASAAGLASRTVAETRKRLGAGTGDTTARIGRDGRVRPLDQAAGRVLAAELIADNPNLSLRQIGSVAGISPETARDVRSRMRRGEDPVPDRQVKGRVKKPSPSDSASEDADHPRVARSSGRDRVGAIERLKGDPALRFSDTGRTLLRMLSVHAVQDEQWRKIADNVPPHCSGVIAQMARDCADMWGALADQVDKKAGDVS